MLASAPAAQAADTTPGPNLLEVRDLSVEYLTDRGPVRAVDHVSFDVLPGEVLGLAGESGSGKSTIAHAVLRLLRPGAVATGEVRIDGRDVLALDAAELGALRWGTASSVLQRARAALHPGLTGA